MTLLIALLSAPAMAQDSSWSRGMSLHLQGGGNPITDESVGTLYPELARNGGLRFGYSLGPSLELLATAKGSTRSRSLYTFTADSDAYIGTRVNTFSYGAGARVVHDSTFHPYAAAQLQLFQVGVRLDGDEEADDNLDQSVSRGFAPGATGALGLELRPQPDWQVQPSLFLEGGYTWSLSSAVGDLGTAQAKGLNMQAGVGLRF